MRRFEKKQNILEANKRLLGESKEDENVEYIVETHVDTDEGKMDYIKSALKNLTSEDLDKVYAQVETLDPKYEGRGKK